MVSISSFVLCQQLGIEDISLYGQADTKDNAFANIYVSVILVITM